MHIQGGTLLVINGVITLIHSLYKRVTGVITLLIGAITPFFLLVGAHLVTTLKGCPIGS